mmetsp:Transcript_8071/g.11529  ORF Transcript_8071/g.11529 Transcript_8071/m.11529 type:complete len:493 (+) Transcript_8071:45-1523(+)
MIVQRLFSLISILALKATASEVSSKEDFLALGDSALAQNEIPKVIRNYELGLEIKEDTDSIVTSLSLFTNLGTAHSSNGDELSALQMYKKAILLHSEKSDEISDIEDKKSSDDIAAQASFFLGMTQEELGNPKKAADAYSYANTLDPLHWASLANLGSILHDKLHSPAEAIISYNKAYEILTQKDKEPTDPPEHPRFVLSQLQYRIGLSVTYADGRKCAMQHEPTRELSCSEIAANAFNLALTLDPDNESARHMLAAVTADATMERASNSYVTSLFEEYAENFEHSLVDELGYDGFQRLRKGFDKAFGGSRNVPRFQVVVDAGCGTGLVGEQFRDISEYLIGVDLSPSIIDEANKARPNLYNETRVGDITEFFRDLKPISLIVAADSFIYFGDLVPLFESIEEGLADNGIIAFTLENVPNDTEESLYANKPDWRWQLTASGRFAHRYDYVKQVGQNHSLRTVHYESMDGFRKEGSMDVRGHMFIMKKIGKEL